jgi:hypothetical protein
MRSGSPLSVAPPLFSSRQMKLRMPTDTFFESAAAPATLSTLASKYCVGVRTDHSSGRSMRMLVPTCSSRVVVVPAASDKDGVVAVASAACVAGS